MAAVLGGGANVMCSKVGNEVWVLAVAATGLFVLFVIATRPFQRWMLERRPRSLGLSLIPRWFFNLWVMKVLGVIPAAMMVAAAMGLYCFFHGPDLPSGPEEEAGGVTTAVRVMTPDGTGPTSVVRALYREYPADGPRVVEREPEQVLSKYFTAEIVRLLVADLACSKRYEAPCFIDGSILFSSQDPEITDLNIGPFDSERKTVEVAFKDHDERRVMRLRVEQTSVGWRVADIVDPQGHSLLRALSTKTD